MPDGFTTGAMVPRWAAAAEATERTSTSSRPVSSLADSRGGGTLAAQVRQQPPQAEQPEEHTGDGEGPRPPGGGHDVLGSAGADGVVVRREEDVVAPVEGQQADGDEGQADHEDEQSVEAEERAGHRETSLVRTLTTAVVRSWTWDWSAESTRAATPSGHRG